jgi:hypothetical protein
MMRATRIDLGLRSRRAVADRTAQGVRALLPTEDRETRPNLPILHKLGTSGQPMPHHATVCSASHWSGLRVLGSGQRNTTPKDASQTSETTLGPARARVQQYATQKVELQTSPQLFLAADLPACVTTDQPLQKHPIEFGGRPLACSAVQHYAAPFRPCRGQPRPATILDDAATRYTVDLRFRLPNLRQALQQFAAPFAARRTSTTARLWPAKYTGDASRRNAARFRSTTPQISERPVGRACAACWGPPTMPPCWNGSPYFRILGEPSDESLRRIVYGTSLPVSRSVFP